MFTHYFCIIVPLVYSPIFTTTYCVSTIRKTIVLRIVQLCCTIHAVLARAESALFQGKSNLSRRKTIYILFIRNNSNIYPHTKTDTVRSVPVRYVYSSSSGTASINRCRAVSASIPCSGLFGVTTTSATSLYPYQFFARKIPDAGLSFPFCI